MKGWTYVRTVLREPKFLVCIDNQIFLPIVLRCARFASVIAPLKIKMQRMNAKNWPGG